MPAWTCMTTQVHPEIMQMHPSLVPPVFIMCPSLADVSHLDCNRLLGSGWKQSTLYLAFNLHSLPPFPPYSEIVPIAKNHNCHCSILTLYMYCTVHEWRKINTYTVFFLLLGMWCLTSARGGAAWSGASPPPSPRTPASMSSQSNTRHSAPGLLRPCLLKVIPDTQPPDSCVHVFSK